MATVKRTPYRLASRSGFAIRGEVNTAGAQDRRPAVLVFIGPEGRRDAAAKLVERLGRAGLTAISVEMVPDWSLDTLEPAAGAVGEFAGNLLEERHPGLAPPRALGLFGEGRHGLLAMAVAAREPRVSSLVTVDPESPDPVQKVRLAERLAGVGPRWLEVARVEKFPPRGSSRGEFGGPSEVRRVSSETEIIDAAVEWFLAMLS
ncbi:hypothetical protein HRbin33_01057 [bacterium HR33]|nr:hypothetical protein HRbin33_01057 [bacterium HR33]